MTHDGGALGRLHADLALLLDVVDAAWELMERADLVSDEEIALDKALAAAQEGGMMNALTRLRESWFHGSLRTTYMPEPVELRTVRASDLDLLLEVVDSAWAVKTRIDEENDPAWDSPCELDALSAALLASNLSKSGGDCPGHFIISPPSCAERESPCPNSDVLEAAEAAVARWRADCITLERWAGGQDAGNAFAEQVRMWAQCRAGCDTWEPNE